MRQQFGLIGKNISYSFSKLFFEKKFKKLGCASCAYTLYHLDNIQQVSTVFSDPALVGLNVTIPYKEKIIPFLDELSEEAAAIGAVNTVLIKDGKKKGYNTDAFGFERTLDIHRSDHQNSALILGDGGAAKAVQYILQKKNIAFQCVTRTGILKFNDLTPELVSRHPLIIQCTPVGTFPNVQECLPFAFSGLSKNHLVIDLIYNPEYTLFLQNAATSNAATVNGLYMLEQQAEKAWEIWNI